MKSENIMTAVFINIIECLNKTKFREEDRLILRTEIKEAGKVDDSIFFKAGQLLAMLYIFNENGLSRNNINYLDGVFYIKDLFKIKSYTNNRDSSCIDIANEIINISVFKKEFLPAWIEVRSMEESKDIEEGFIQVYNYLLEEKFSLIKIIEGYGYEELFGDLINKFKVLNNNDLNRQLKLIRLRLGYNYGNKIFSEKITDYNKQEFIEISCKTADELIQSSIIGFYNNDIEITWLRYSENKVISISEKNLYISLFLSYLSKNTRNKYYLQPAIESIRPVIRDFNLQGWDKDAFDYKHTLSTIHYINNIVKIEGLKSFIENNNELFKECTKESIDKEVLLNEALEIINDVIL